MKREDWMLFSLTFLTGAAIGMYAYIAVWKPVYAPEEIGSQEDIANEWSVVGKRRGGEQALDYIQPSFRLLGNGSYTYLPGGNSDVSFEPKEGKLKRALLNELKVTEETLKLYEVPVNNAKCASETGGYDYEYRFTVKGNTYTLDTCETKLGTNTTLSNSLLDVWQSFSGQTKSYNSVSDWVEAWINRNIGVSKEE